MLLFAPVLFGVDTAQAGGKTSATRFAQVTVNVAGDVDAALVDGRGRRTGWYSGRVEDIPGCTLEAMHDDVLQPRDYSFHFSSAWDRSFRLLVTPPAGDEVSINIEASLANGKRCVARTTMTLEGGEHQWRLGWKAVRDTCTVTITPVSERKPGGR